MKIKIVCVGKIKEDYLRQAYGEYAKRLSRFCDLSLAELEESTLEENSANIEKIRIEEGGKILKQLKGRVFALDGRGVQPDSKAFAEMIKSCRDSGEEITFVIGGSNGLSDEVRQKADKLISFGKMTFPHQLFRVMLTEQIYRAFMILSGANYHK